MYLEMLMEFLLIMLVPLPYNLSSQKSSSGGGRLQAKLSRLNPQLNAVMLCFGEIDCRAHIVKQAYIHKKSIQSAAEDTAAAYLVYTID